MYHVKMASSRTDEEDRDEGSNSIITKQIGYQWELVSPNLLRVHVPTIPYEAFDSAGHIQPWHLLDLLDSGGMHNYWPLEFSVYPYVLHVNLTIDASLYNTDSPKFPLILEYTNLFVNKSSRGVQITLYHESMPKPYAVRKQITVNVDPVTRRPKAFPSWWREKHQFPTSDVKQELADPQPPADGKYMINQRSVHFNDIDTNKHMNYKAYVRFCYESLFENMFANGHCYGADSMLVGNTRELQMVFKHECLLGDVLTIKSWKDDVATDTYHFELWKQTKLVTIVTLSFYKRDAACSQPSKL